MLIMKKTLKDFVDSLAVELPVGEELTEVLDSKGKMLMIMPRSEVLKQELNFKAVLIMFISTNNKVYIQKRAKHKYPYPGQWTCSASGWAQAGESLEDSALRELEEEVGIKNVPLKLIATHVADKSTNNAALSLYITEPSLFIPSPNSDEVEDGMFVDLDELAVLIKNFPELMTPSICWAYNCLRELDCFKQTDTA